MKRSPLSAQRPTHLAAKLILALSAAGVIRRIAPRPGHDPQTYLWDAYVATHAQDMNDPFVTYAAGMQQAWSGETGNLAIEVRPDMHRVTRIHALRAALEAVHPHAFAAVMWTLRTLLAPYDPIFTAADALDADTLVQYGDGWLDSIQEAYMDAHDADGDADLYDLDVVMTWAKATGHGVPDDLNTKYPEALYRADVAFLHALGRATDARVVAVRDFLAYLDTLPVRFACRREWAEGEVPWRPGAVNVLVYMDTVERDPVLEAYREVEDCFEMQDPEPLHLARIQDPDTHEDFITYLRTLTEVQARTRAFWDTVKDPD